MTMILTEPPTILADQVCLLDGPSVFQHGCLMEVPNGCKRLLAFIALRRAKVDRRLAAGSLWPDGSEERAFGNLRSSLWRLKGAGIEVVVWDHCTVGLREHTRTDLQLVCDWADRVLAEAALDVDLRIPDCARSAAELLPGWYDDWVVFERERIRQRILHALEALSRLLRVGGRHAEAVEAAMEAIALEPLRESAHRSLARAHVAEGNVIEARHTFERYQELARRELGVEPSLAFRSWVQTCAPCCEVPAGGPMLQLT